jgi:tryptophan 2,3-dioxygenase
VTTNAPQHGSMTHGDIRAARAMYDTVRQGTYWQAAAVNASYVDADAVVREWRRARVEDAERVREIPVVLWAALEVLADGWPS